MMSVQELQVKKEKENQNIQEMELTYHIYFKYFECYNITVIFHIGILKIPKAKKLTQKLLSAYYKLDKCQQLQICRWFVR